MENHSRRMLATATGAAMMLAGLGAGTASAATYTDVTNTRAITGDTEAAATNNADSTPAKPGVIPAAKPVPVPKPVPVQKAKPVPVPKPVPVQKDSKPKPKAKPKSDSKPKPKPS
ncbi:hypothetical protein [Nocardia suismassiliense]|uniref:hypothetical protein n=1 Tax=Nocardia suismassiliense TaxID=2077092 RepID=UPI00131EEF60|nr:hypothetical protein [Nocardia suismassiliense]